MIKLKIYNQEEVVRRYFAWTNCYMTHIDGLDQQGRLAAISRQCDVNSDLFLAVIDNFMSGVDWIAILKSDVKHFERCLFADLPDQTSLDARLGAVAGFSVIVVSTTDGKTFICPECKLPKLEQLLLDGMLENEQEPDFSSGAFFVPIKW